MPVTITFAPGLTGIIQLAGPLPPLSTSMAVQGPGANVLTVRRNSGFNHRIFLVSNNTTSGPVVSLSGLTITNRNTGGGNGGGILNSFSTLTVNDCVVSGNAAAYPSTGGGIFNNQGTLTINNSTVSGNTAFSGGGIGNYRSDPGTASLVVTNGTLASNVASGGNGGAFHNDVVNTGSTAAVVLTNCTLSGNQTSGIFGGNGGAVLNSASSGGSGTFKLTNCTLANNTAAVSGGSVANLGGQVMLANTILRSVNPNLVNNSGGTITSQGYNLSNDNGGGFLTGTADQINTDPQLGALAANGGPTQTHALLPGSPAINAGDDALAPKLDQRRYLRVGLADIGAFEFGGTPLRITSIVRLTNGRVVLQGIGVPNAVHTIVASPDLRASFGEVGTATANGAGALQYDDAGAAGLTMRFYRLRFP